MPNSFSWNEPRWSNGMMNMSRVKPRSLGSAIFEILPLWSQGLAKFGRRINGLGPLSEPSVLEDRHLAADPVDLRAAEVGRDDAGSGRALRDDAPPGVDDARVAMRDAPGVGRARLGRRDQVA